MSFVTKIFGDPNEREIKKARARVERINALEPEIKKLTDKQLKEETNKFKKQLESGKKLDDILERAFAVVREASRRTIGQRHFDVQLVGGIVLHEGKIAEMKTGEGKTLVATLPLYLNALSGKGAHLVTVNDYLARLGAGWMAQIYHFLGLSTAVIKHDEAFLYDPEFIDDSHHDERLQHLKPISRKEAYGADITYGTNNEFGFDYLRDNMVQDSTQMVQRPLNYAIVDEVDSILIDEARTPLIISQPAQKSTDRYYTFAKLARSLKPEKDYTIDEKQKAVSLTDDGIKDLEKSLGLKNIYEPAHIEDVHLIEQSLKAEALFKRDRDYVVSPDGEIVIVDEFTGRLLPGRRYSEGLHQAIEAKENVTVQAESQTLATITFQNLFRLYDKLSGMTGTALTEAEEFSKIYNLEVTVIPTHMPMVRQDMKDRIYKTQVAKYDAVVADVAERYAKGQPVLIGTVSIERNEYLSSQLKKARVPHQLLNAKNNESEAETVAAAGQKGAVTLATNIAGRGTDIVLGEGVKDLGGLHVLGTERHESRRIDNQLRGRAGRQGDPGSSQFFVSLEDDLMRIFGGERIGSLMNTLNIPDDTPIENKMITRALETAQKRVEGHNFDIRKHLVEYDDVMNSHREIIYKMRRTFLGGDNLKKEILAMVRSGFASVVAANTNASTNVVDLDGVAKQAENIIPLDNNWSKKVTSKLPNDIIDDLTNKAERLYGKKEKEFGESTSRLVERLVCLQVVDRAWLQHLETMEHLREGIGLRGYGQRDPLVEYKAEAYKIFQGLQNGIDAEISQTIFKVSVQPQEVIEIQPETAITEGAKHAIASTEIEDRSKPAKTPKANKLSHAASPELKPIRKRLKKKKKKR
ncbi:preprotein translocase subunit SecA [Candidatus Saccharibacteria bacterium]|nr:preprotein translocase subunit SecA [Candidatus Saccharibacteria bacterium]